MLPPCDSRVGACRLLFLLLQLRIGPERKTNRPNVAEDGPISPSINTTGGSAISMKQISNSNVKTVTSAYKGKNSTVPILLRSVFTSGHDSTPHTKTKESSRPYRKDGAESASPFATARLRARPMLMIP